MNALPAYSKKSEAHHFVLALVEGLRWELELTPKPGLVDKNNSGSHTDLSYQLMSRSIDLLESYFYWCVRALEAGCELEDLRRLGTLTEKIMFRRFGTNTHRGAIFLGGLLIYAIHTSGVGESIAMSIAVAVAARRLFSEQTPINTTGASVRRRFHTGGIIAEALNGLPCVFKIGVPALKMGCTLGMSSLNSRLLTMAVLMQHVDDTTALRRCGTEGLETLRADGKQLEKLLLNREDPYPFLLDADQKYCKSRLTMGGVADLLAICMAWNFWDSADEPWRYSLC